MSDYEKALVLPGISTLHVSVLPLTVGPISLADRLVLFCLLLIDRLTLLSAPLPFMAANRNELFII
jgi:hypothetical protein